MILERAELDRVIVSRVPSPREKETGRDEKGLQSEEKGIQLEENETSDAEASVLQGCEEMTFRLDGHLEDFDPDDFLKDLSWALGVSTEQLTILDIRIGSIIVTVRIRPLGLEEYREVLCKSYAIHRLLTLTLTLIGRFCVEAMQYHRLEECH